MVSNTRNAWNSANQNQLYHETLLSNPNEDIAATAMQLTGNDDERNIPTADAADDRPGDGFPDLDLAGSGKNFTPSDCPEALLVPLSPE